MDDQQLSDRIRNVIEASSYRWRTVGGLSSELGAVRTDVERVLANSGAFVRAQAPSGSGEALYTTVARYRRDTPFVERLFGAGANTVAS